MRWGTFCVYTALHKCLTGIEIKSQLPELLGWLVGASHKRQIEAAPVSNFFPFFNFANGIYKLSFI
jgi:hypothetical protein